METLVTDLRNKLQQRKRIEIEKCEQLTDNADKELLLLSSGRLLELDFLIRAIDDMVDYHKKTKAITN